ncbi:hypothetical protein [Kibdelosporangium phytohabitans]|uniref:Uncharacterized protein n=1 Tax=Kibdelosporangium phytohabitans TaxID=860235 RepID=A0A0N9I3V5_9PSEU|nr:hypothetical protein [Kibdelosporangium phytohabitans]ALG09209.1 hypothetical protein AOZ06_21895 [Kibdelosporangium phytohabitans]MBE1469558.1 hypothetical protein [Kibdelosporangium phytohabitans]
MVAGGTRPYGGPFPAPGGDHRIWRNEVAQPGALALLAIGRYDVKVSTGPGGGQVVTAYGTDLGPLDAPARAPVERTPEIVEARANWFGPCPYAGVGDQSGRRERLAASRH